MSLWMEILLLAPTILISLSVHELAHGWMALRFGDPTARDAGRLSLNPLKHLDPLGTIALFIFKLGWAKPVPVNPYYFKNPRQDLIWVSLAGPGSNMLLGLAGALILRGLIWIDPVTGLINQYVLLGFFYFVWINFILAFFNLVPIPPLDGSKVALGLLPEAMEKALQPYLRYGPLVLIGLIFFGDRIGLDLFGSTILPLSRLFVKFFTGIEF